MDRADEIAREVVTQNTFGTALTTEADDLRETIAAALRSYGDDLLTEADKRIDRLINKLPIGGRRSSVMASLRIVRDLKSQPIQDKTT